MYALHCDLPLVEQLTKLFELSGHIALTAAAQLPYGFSCFREVNMKAEKVDAVFQRKYLSLLIQLHTFNGKGYRTAKNAEFNKNSFRSMFKNERYIGIYKYKDLRIDGGVPAIVDKETFAIVQKRLGKNAEAPSRGKAKIDYLLSQKLFCGHCGSLMTGESGTGKSGSVYHYYTCGKRKRGQGCDKKPLKKDFIERAVVEDAMSLLNPETIDELADIAVNESVREREENSIIPALREQLKGVESSINNLIKMVEKGVESDSLADRLKELEKEKRAIEKRLVVVEDDYVILEKDHVVWWMEQFCNGDIEDEDFRRHIIDLLVNSVTVWDEPDGWYKITSVYNLTSAKSKTFKCSDLACNTSPNVINPDCFVDRNQFGFIFFAEITQTD